MAIKNSKCAAGGERQFHDRIRGGLSRGGAYEIRDAARRLVGVVSVEA